jgi:serine/threonine-protein kinase RsbW
MSEEADEVRLDLPARGEFVSTVRMLTAGVAARCDLTVDQIEDLLIAVDEACALLFPHAPPGAHLSARFILAPGDLEVVVSVPADRTATPDRTGFAWTVLSALADDLTVDNDERRLLLSIRKHRLVRGR